MNIEYRMFFNNKPATREQLDRVEEITVEQEVDMVWEARIQIPLCVDDKGKWTKEDKDFMKSFSRIRVEIKIGEEPFIALIDGTIVGFDSQRSSEPGKSSITLKVQDDSMYLNREESVLRFENLKDDEIASQLFQDVGQIASTDIEETPSPPGSLPPVVVQRGTKMQLLRFLARRQGMHAYVLPGESSGQSIGCFKSFPTQTDGLPPLTLLGSDRNMETFNPGNDTQRPARVKASSLGITDKTVTTRTSRFDDLELLGDEQGFENESDTAVQLLPPHQGESVDLDRAVNAEALNSSYSFDATGSVLSHCYKGVLQPYRVVTVKGADERSSGNYVITRVTHTLTRSDYSQSFSLKRNARSAGSVVSGSSIPQGSTNLQVSFNFSLSIF